MPFQCNTSTFQDTEKEALWYLSSKSVIEALGEQLEGVFHLTEFVIPAGTLVYPHIHHKEDEAHYVIEGNAIISCAQQILHVSAGTFLFLPCNVPHHMEVSTSGPFRYLTWMMPAGFAHEVTQMGTPNNALLLAPPSITNRAKIQSLAHLLRKCSISTSLEDLYFSYK